LRKIFLACPYGNSDPAIVEHRFEVSNTIAATIVRAGDVVFSQVSMSHPINGVMPDLDKVAIGALWAPVDAFFMDAMDELIVIDIEGWRESSGVAREIAFFEQRRRRTSLWSEVAHEFAPKA
jgi:hypothetical protein